MMPVIRVSDPTWERLKSYARPFEDKPEDIVNLALDALDEKLGRASKPQAKAIARKATPGKKLPQKEFRIPLMKVMFQLGGSADASVIRRTLEPSMAPLLSEADHAPVSTGDPRWWNAVCWERADLVREGLLLDNSPRGVWELSENGKAFARRH